MASLLAMPPLSWPELADLAAEAVRERAAALQLEGVRGLEALPERELQELLALALRARGLEVLREERYPIHRGRKKRSSGMRCDLVVRRPGAALEEGAWLEVKRARHFAEADRPGSAAPLAAGVIDVVRLASDGGITHGAVVLFLAARDDEAGARQVGRWAHACLDEGLPIELPCIRHVPLPNLVGNGTCTLAVLPITAARA